MVIESSNMLHYLPQRPPFVMIDNLLEASGNRFVSSFLIKPDNLFVDDNEFREFGLIENMAQTGAAGISYSGLSAVAVPTDGFIGAISKLQLHALPKIGDTLTTIATVLHSFANLYLLKGECFTNGRLLIECEMKLAGMTPAS